MANKGMQISRLALLELFQLQSYLQRLGQNEVGLFDARALANRATEELKFEVTLWNMKRALKILQLKTKIGIARSYGRVEKKTAYNRLYLLSKEMQKVREQNKQLLEEISELRAMVTSLVDGLK